MNDDYCYLTTRGRRTGADHEIEIWYVRETAQAGRDTLYLLAGAGEQSDWVRNLQVDPSVRVRIDDVTHEGRTARVVTDPTEDRRTRARSCSRSTSRATTVSSSPGAGVPSPSRSTCADP